MRYLRTLLSFATAATAVPVVLLTVPAFAQTASPIHIDSCDVKKVHSEYGLGSLFVKGKGYNFFNVTFTNTSKETVKHIVFQVEFEKSRYEVTDVGSFTPGEKVTHRLRDHGKDTHAFARTGTGPTECSVLSATFSNGETWKAAPAKP